MAGHGKCGEARPGAVTDLPEESDGEVSGFEDNGTSSGFASGSEVEPTGAPIACGSPVPVLPRASDAEPTSGPTACSPPASSRQHASKVEAIGSPSPKTHVAPASRGGSDAGSDRSLSPQSPVPRASPARCRRTRSRSAAPAAPAKRQRRGAGRPPAAVAKSKGRRRRVERRARSRTPGASGDEGSPCGPCSRSVSPITPKAGTKRGATFAEKREREVYVGDLPTRIPARVVQTAFEELFLALPQYRERYAHLQSPVVAVTTPPGKAPPVGFVFVEFADAVLASTAVSMSGLWIGGKSARVNRPSAGPGDKGAPEGLDLEPLRLGGQIPWVPGPGATMVSEIWLSGFARHCTQNVDSLRRELSAALLSIPAVQRRFPGLEQAVNTLKVGGDGAYAFAELAHEVLASTAVAMGGMMLPDGHYVRTGWPGGRPDAALRGPPPLEVPPVADPRREKREKDQHRFAAACAWEVEAACEIYIGATRGLRADEIWGGLVELFQSLPSYLAAYADTLDPVVNLRTSAAPYAFARLADPVLASTAVALGSFEVCGRPCPICRPSHYAEPPSGAVPPLGLSHSGRSGQATRPARPGRPGTGPQSNTFNMLWVGNLTPVRPTEKAREHLDEHLTGLALSSPNYDLELGPPVKRISLHHSGHFAFVEIRDAELAEQLIPIFDGSEFMGREIAVNWATPRGGRRPYRGPREASQGGRQPSAQPAVQQEPREAAGASGGGSAVALPVDSDDEA